MIAQPHIEFLQAFGELSKLTRRAASQRGTLASYKNTARAMLRRDEVCGNTLLGLVACLEHDLDAMHAYHKTAIELNESCFSLIYYAVSLEKSCLWNESARFGLLALDYDPGNLKILEALIKLVPLTGRFSLFKRLLPLWEEANNGAQHTCHNDYDIISELLAKHGVLEKDLKELIAAIGEALSGTNVITKDFRYEIVPRRREAPFIHFRFAIADDLVASECEDVVDARLAQVFYHPRLSDAFSYSIENASVYKLYESMEKEISGDADSLRVPDPEQMKLIEELTAGVGGGPW